MYSSEIFFREDMSTILLFVPSFVNARVRELTWSDSKFIYAPDPHSPQNAVTRVSSHVYTEYDFHIVLNETRDQVAIVKAVTRNRDGDADRFVCHRDYAAPFNSFATSPPHR